MDRSGKHGLISSIFLESENSRLTPVRTWSIFMLRNIREVFENWNMNNFSLESLEDVAKHANSLNNP